MRMALWEILLVSTATSMDIFAVTISNTFLHPDESRGRLAWMPVSFAVFQGVFPILGFLLGGLVGDLIEAYAPVVTLCVLGFIGMNMLREGIVELRADEGGDERVADELPERRLARRSVLLQSLVTSVDVFAIGVSMRALEADVVFVGACNAVVTALICLAGIGLGRRYGHLLGDYALIAGGIVLACVGVSAML